MLFTIGLNARIASDRTALVKAARRAGLGVAAAVVAVVADPGFSSTGVNIQHNLGHSLMRAPDGLLQTQTMHDVAGQHAADGALPMVLACLEPDIAPNAWFTSGTADDTKGPPGKADPTVHKGAAQDPFNAGSRGNAFGPGAATAFWEMATEATGAIWDS